jgi:UDP-2,3-diacylglucosamine pyrophosphatase LpxH
VNIVDGLLEKNLLVISDLHLGGDLKPGAPSLSAGRQIARLESELAAFFAHYAAHRLDGRPWRLVVNGDMVDFMAMLILPDAGAGSLEERQFGLAYGESQSHTKLERVFDRHAEVFRRLAAFVEAGHELVIVVGNHDAEFFYPAVQRCFTERLASLSTAPGRAAIFRAAIRFCPWFYYEENVVYVEHGHQYDEYCAFDYLLHPVAEGAGIELSVAHAGMRYFTNLVPQMPSLDAETWGFFHYLRWGLAHGARTILRILYCYGSLVFQSIGIWSALTNRRSDRARAAHHGLALRALACRYRIAVEALEALDRLRCPPLMKRLSRIFSALFVDRILLGATLALGVLLAMVTTGGWSRLAAAAGVLCGGVAASWVLSLRTRFIPSASALRRVPSAIWRIMRTPFIVFGHSHTVERIELGGGGTYINTGSWIESRGQFPHLIIRDHERGPRAELRGWADGASAPYPPRPV